MPTTTNSKEAELAELLREAAAAIRAANTALEVVFTATGFRVETERPKLTVLAGGREGAES